MRPVAPHAESLVVEPHSRVLRLTCSSPNNASDQLRRNHPTTIFPTNLTDLLDDSADLHKGSDIPARDTHHSHCRRILSPQRDNCVIGARNISSPQGQEGRRNVSSDRDVLGVHFLTPTSLLRFSTSRFAACLHDANDFSSRVRSPSWTCCASRQSSVKTQLLATSRTPGEAVVDLRGCTAHTHDHSFHTGRWICYSLDPKMIRTQVAAWILLKELFETFWHNPCTRYAQ
jgi:hypothetical protein